MKKRISLLLACCMLLCMAPVALADADIQIEDGAAVELPQGVEIVEDGALALELDALELDAPDEPSAPAEEAPAQATPAQNATLPNGAEDIEIDKDMFPDATFRKYVAEKIDLDHDGVLSEKECKAVTKIEVNQQNITSLEGIGFFPELRELSCYGNKLTSLYLFKSTELKTLTCYGNKLTHLNLYECRELESLTCFGNRMTELNVSKCAKLKSLSCFGNKLTELDVSKCAALESLECHNNRLTSLNAGNCARLEKLNCFDNKLTSLNLNGCKKLSSVLCEKNELKELDLTDSPNLIHAMKKGNDISALLGYTDIKCMESGKGRISFDDTMIIVAKGKTLYKKAGSSTDPISIKKCKVEGINDQTYTGKAFTPDPVVKYGNTTLKRDTDYTVSYSNNREIGTGKVTIKGKGAYNGAVTLTFKINPKPVKLTSLTSGKSRNYPGYRQMTVKWEKGSDGVGYQVQYRPRFGNRRNVVVRNTEQVSQVIDRLTPGVRYYVRIRTYKKVGTETYYSAWSEEKNAIAK